MTLMGGQPTRRDSYLGPAIDVTGKHEKTTGEQPADLTSYRLFLRGHSCSGSVSRCLLVLRYA